jgi:hypothetical protein
VRTTLTLDEDVAKLLKKEARKSGEPFKQAVNRFLRLGLRAAKQPSQEPFVVKPWNLRPPPGLDFDNIGDLIEALEGPYHR